MDGALAPLNTEKQRIFVDAYVETGDVGDAADRAGLSTKHCYHLLNKDHVQQAIQQKREEVRERSSITAAEVANGLLKEAKYGRDEDKEGASHSARVRAWELLGEHLGLFDETRADDSSDQINIYQQINQKLEQGE